MIFLVQTLMLSRALEEDVVCGYAEIQGWVDRAHAQSAVLSSKRDTLAARVKELEEYNNYIHVYISATRH